MSKPRVVRLRQLSPAQEARLVVLRHLSRLLDSAFEVPGTGYRIGLDPIIGLLPGLGDLVSPVFAVFVLWQSRELVARRSRLTRLNWWRRGGGERVWSSG